jgi:hypothetical protein
MPGLLTYILGNVQIFLTDLWTNLDTFNALITDHFGEPGKWAFWVLASAFVLLILGKATKIAFNVMRYVLLPSAGLAVLLLMLMPCWSPAKTFPLLIVVTTVMMLFRNN